MAILITLQGPEVGRRFPLEAPCTLLGRQYDAPICLTGKAVSRQHAQILRRDAEFLVEDLDSSNGTFLNGMRLSPRSPVPISEKDTLQVGPYVFALHSSGSSPAHAEPNLVVREKISTASLNQTLYSQDSSQKLQVVIEIAQNLGRTLDLDNVLDKLLEQVLRLFPQSDRALVILYEGDKLVVRAQRCRGARDETAIPFSRTVVRTALEEGAGILSDDVQSDERFSASQTLTSLGLHSVLCVPLITQEERRLGVIQLDRFRKGPGYRSEDLHLLTAVSLQVAVVLENVELHAQKLREERLQQELALAREIQQGFLPRQVDTPTGAQVEVYGRVFPARQVAGDLYDYLTMPDGRLAFFIGDVSGKGMPAALFMVAVRTLCRHLTKEGYNPSEILKRLNAALADDNPSCMFVTLTHGFCDPRTGEVMLTAAGHPSPLLRRADGRVERVTLPRGRLLGYDTGDLHLSESRLQLEPGDTLVFFTDGMLEAKSPVDKSMFGLDRFEDVVSGFLPKRSLHDCSQEANNALELFTGSKELQDDVTLLMIRRK